MHPGGSLEYQFAVAPYREMIRDFARVPLSPHMEAMSASYDIGNLWASAFLWYLGGVVAR
jgi:hypothetical protein